MESEEAKRRRIEIEIVERVRQGLPLTNDAMTYLLNKFDLESLNRMYRTSWTMRNFFETYQIWRRKFLKLVAEWVSPDQPQIETLEEAQGWIDYWDYLVPNHNPYQLLAAFVIVHSSASSNQNEIVLFKRFPNFRHICGVKFTTIPVSRRYGNDIVPRLSTMVLHPFIGADQRFVDDFYNYGSQVVSFQEQLKTFGDITSSDKVDDWGFERPFNPNVPLGHVIIHISLIHSDSVELVYQLLALGYRPPESQDFRRVETELCGYCLSSNISSKCGVSDCNVKYCNQNCADAHWSSHEAQCRNF